MRNVIDIKTGRPVGERRNPLPIGLRMERIIRSLEEINRLMKALKEEANKL